MNASHSARKYKLLTTLGSSHYKVLHGNTDRQVVAMVIGVQLLTVGFFMVMNIGKFSPHTRNIFSRISCTVFESNKNGSVMVVFVTLFAANFIEVGRCKKRSKFLLNFCWREFVSTGFN